MPPSIPSNEHFPIICICLGNRSHYQVNSLPRAALANSYKQLLEAPRSMLRASADSGAGKASPRCALSRYRDFQDYQNLCSHIPPPASTPRLPMGARSPAPDLPVPVRARRAAGPGMSCGRGSRQRFGGVWLLEGRLSIFSWSKACVVLAGLRCSEVVLRRALPAVGMAPRSSLQPRPCCWGVKPTAEVSDPSRPAPPPPPLTPAPPP